MKKAYFILALALVVFAAAPVSAQVVLWDQQPPAAADNAWNSYYDTSGGTHFFSSDDFTSADTWAISTFTIPGVAIGGTPSACNTQFYIDIFADDGMGAPEGIPLSFPYPFTRILLNWDDPQISFSDNPRWPGYAPQSTVTVNLANPRILPPGDWWLSVYAITNVSCQSWFWEFSPAMNGNQALYSVDFGVWQPIGFTNDLAFTLEGEVVQPGNLSEALDTLADVAVSGDADWLGLDWTTNDGIDAARSGPITHSQSTTMEVVAQGPGDGSFWWSVSSESCCDPLRFSIDGVIQNGIAGDVPWAEVPFTLDPGTHTLTWTYSKDSSVDTGTDAGFVDMLSLPNCPHATYNAASGILDVPVVEVAGSPKAYDVDLSKTGGGFDFIVAGAAKTAGLCTSGTFTPATGVLDLPWVDIAGTSKSYIVELTEQPGGDIFSLTNAAKK